MHPRIIPVLLLDSRRRLIKTRGFGDEAYLGDPFNILRIFNEKEVDEICVLDINATVERRRPDAGFVAELASECFMPLSYGGGIAAVADAAPIFAAGVEKVVLGRAGADATVIREISGSYGSQAVAVCADFRRFDDGARVFLDRGSRDTGLDPVAFARTAEQAGAGEIVLQSIDRDGTREGYDTRMIAEVAGAVGIPIVALGGAGELRHLMDGLAAGASAAASGSTFVFIGRLRAVLITYPQPDEVRATLAPERPGL
jgi:imidazole glycerol-phosphate synthase subunit HisF